MFDAFEVLIGPIILIVGLTGWLWKLHGNSGENSKHVIDLKRANGKLFEKLDLLGEKVAVHERATQIHSSMLKPENLERHHKEMMELVMEVKFLKEKVQELRAKNDF
jgi:hypothetical protein